MKIVSTVVLLLIVTIALVASGVAPAAYNLLQNNAVSVAQRSTLNFVNGGCVDNAGALRTDCTFITSSTLPANATCAFTAQTSVTCTHNLNTTAVVVQVYNNGSPPQLIIPDTVKATSANVVTVTFTASSSGTVVVNGSVGSGGGGITNNQTIRSFGGGFDGGGSALTAGKTTYYTVPFACTIAAWNITVDTGTATVDVWKIATGTAIPTVANTITAAAIPAISSGTAAHSTNLTGWTTAVAANDIFGINLKVVSGATAVSLVVQCNAT